MPTSTMSRRPTARIGLIGLAVLFLTVLWAPAAGAAPALDIPLAPPEAMVVLIAVENEGVFDVDDPDTVPPFTTVTAEWTGTATVTLPAGFDGSAMDVYLELAPTDTDPPSKTYSTTTPGPNGLVVTDLGGGQYSVALPADDTVNGPFGHLSFEGITTAAGASAEVLPLSYLLEFTGTGGLARSLTTQVLVLSTTPCAFSSPTPCAPYKVNPGAQFTMTVPPGSLLRTLGLGTLDTVRIALEPTDEDGYPIGDPTIELMNGAGATLAAAVERVETSASAPEAAPALEAIPAAQAPAAAAAPVTIAAGIVSTAPNSITVTLPATIPVGRYSVSVLEGAPAPAGVSITSVDMDVVAVPRAMNAGLRSDTGWTEGPTVETSPGAPLVALGGSLLLMAGLGTVAVLQGRRAAAAEE